jgi:exodeoxyribonuclease V gamma subunit
LSSLKVYTHYDLNKLADQFAADIKVRPQGMDVLSPEQLIVQTAGMKRWLALESTRRNKIFTQVAVLSPTQFIMKLGFLLMGVQEKRTVFEEDVLPWALYRLIMEGVGHNVPQLEQLKRYGGDDTKEMRLFSLANQVGDIFDQYMLYRPDWLDDWEKGKRLFLDQEAEVWQSYLWRKLLSENDIDGVVSRADYFRRLAEKIEQSTEADKHRLPHRVFLFGMSILPKQYLDIFSRLGGLIDVTMYLQVPSVYYFGDLQSDRQILWRERKQLRAGLDASRHDRGGHRLLANLGEMGRDFMDLLLQTNAEVNELYDLYAITESAGEPASLLKAVQRDIVLCNDPPAEPVLCQEDTWSIRLASCYGPLREVEVLHDLLLDCFSEDPTLSPSDVLVVTPDVAEYGPLVQMVFSDAKQRCGVSIPFTIADQSALTENPVARFTEEVLTAATGRFEVSVILPLFESACELSKQPLSAQERERLGRWCHESGIRWGFDASFRRNLQLPEDEKFTWRYGIDRLIAGYAMDDEAKLSNGILPVVEIEGEGAELLGRLASFVDSLAELALLTPTSRTMNEWANVVAPLIRMLLAAGETMTEEDSSEADAVGQAFGRLRERTVISATQALSVPFSVFMQQVVAELSQTSSGGKFLSGAVTVAGMVPMRSIPFRVVAMIGMNRGKFPRHNVRPLFDLMSHSARRIGDRDSLGGDRYIFLEMLLAAKEKLIITWSGFDSFDGSVIPPSSLVDQFSAHLNREYRLEGSEKKAGEAVQVNYPLHPFSSRYRFAKESQLRTWNKTWFETPGARALSKPVFQWVVEKPPSENVSEDAGEMNGNKIVRLLGDPMKSFLEEGCRIRPPRDEEIPEDGELFKSDGLNDWNLRDAVLREMLCDEKDAVEKLAAQCGVPPGSPGDKAVALARKSMERRVEKIKLIDKSPKFETHRISFEADGRRYRMDVKNLSLKDSSAILFDAGRIDGKKRLKLWVTHLFLNLQKPVETSLVTLDKTTRLTPLDQSEAIEHIIALESIATESERVLLPFIPGVSWAFVEPDKDGIRNIAKCRENAWKALEELLGLAYGKDYRIDDRYVSAFGGVTTWEEAMSIIPGGEKVFGDLAETIFAPFLKLSREQKDGEGK